MERRGLCCLAILGKATAVVCEDAVWGMVRKAGFCFLRREWRKGGSLNKEYLHMFLVEVQHLEMGK